MKIVKKNATGQNKREIDIEPTDYSNQDWQGGKIAGTIFPINKNDKIIGVRAGVNYTGQDNKKYRDEKTFYVFVPGKKKNNKATYCNSIEEATKLVKQWQKTTSDNRYVTKNKYKLIFINGKPTYVIIQLTQNYVTLCDIDQLDFIKKHSLFITRSGGENKKKICCFFI